MKNLFKTMLIVTTVISASCNSTPATTETQTDNSGTTTGTAGQSAVKDDVSSKNLVQVASGSADHTTLVTAVKAGELVDAAFAKLPAGTVDDLLKPENKEALVNILEYHVSVAVYKAENFTDGQNIGQVNGGNIKITKKDGKIFVNDKAEIVASIPTSNGIIHVINEVLLPGK